ncbi:MAG: ClbS/DfsB family four-helix bundle protein [Candidatus Bipolaricaulia bacterium]
MRVGCLIEAIEAARENWDYVITLVPEDKREWKATPQAWSLKDIIAHVAWHDDQMIELAETRDLVGSPWWDLPMDERNDKIYEQYKDKPIDEVLAFAEEAYTRMMAGLRTLSDEGMNDPKRFTDMPEDWIPWRMIASNTYEHYLRHIAQVRTIARALKE